MLGWAITFLVVALIDRTGSSLVSFIDEVPEQQNLRDLYGHFVDRVFSLFGSPADHCTSNNFRENNCPE